MKKTVLYDEHVNHGGKIVEFAGYLLPIEYQSIAVEHQAVRDNVGLFDVSHMGEIIIKGNDATKFVNFIFSNEISTVNNKRMTYGMLLNVDGGVVDDLMVYKFSWDYYYLVVNASNKDRDFGWIISNKNGFDVEIIDASDYTSQLALQGPLAVNVLQKITDYNLSVMKLFDFDNFKILGKEFLVSRSGYTGEDGFEIYGTNDDILMLFRHFADVEKVQLCGLGCRDTLRFEAAMPLYGHEIDMHINPLEAGLNYGLNLSKEDFIGRDALMFVQTEGLKRKVVGIELIDRGIARSGYEVEKDNQVIGIITTGYMIPNTDRSYAMALIDSRYAKIGTELYVKIRKNKVLAKVRNKKFLDKKYVR